MKHTVPQIVSELDKAKFSAYPSELIQMFVDHEDIIINSNEVRYLNLNPLKTYNAFLASSIDNTIDDRDKCFGM